MADLSGHYSRVFIGSWMQFVNIQRFSQTKLKSKLNIADSVIRLHWTLDKFRTVKSSLTCCCHLATFPRIPYCRMTCASSRMTTLLINLILFSRCRCARVVKPLRDNDLLLFVFDRLEVGRKFNGYKGRHLLDFETDLRSDAALNCMYHCC
jgi:hypothetical protein